MKHLASGDAAAPLPRYGNEICFPVNPEGKDDASIELIRYTMFQMCCKDIRFPPPFEKSPRLRERVVATLTSIPPRLPRLKIVIESLLHQTYTLDHIYLVLPDRWSKDRGQPYVIPEDLRALEQSAAAFSIVRCNPDLSTLIAYLCVAALEPHAQAPQPTPF